MSDRPPTTMEEEEEEEEQLDQAQAQSTDAATAADADGGQAASAAAAAAASYESPGAAQPDLWTSGLLAALQPGVQACDQQIEGVFAAQQQLAQQIDRLADGTMAPATSRAAIQSFHSLSRSPSLLGYTSKLVTSRKRIKKSAGDLAKVAARLDDIRALVRKKEGIKAPPASATSMLQKLTGSKDSSPNRSRTASVALSASAAAAVMTAAAPDASVPPSSSSSSSASGASGLVSPDAGSINSPAGDASTTDATAQATPTSSRTVVTNLLNWD